MKRKNLTVTFYVDGEYLWRWRLQAANGKIIADSGQGYKRFRGAEEGFALTQDQGFSAKQIKNDGQKITVLWDPDAVDPDNSP